MAKRILAIDDDKGLLSLLQFNLEAEGYEIQTLADPMRTEEYIDKFKPDLMIIDILMPGRSGFNILDDFKREGKYQGIPKIFLTCLDDDIEKMVARGCGVENYITKPFKPAELLKVIKNILG
ncbi:MAG: response regulator [Candidatus Omnitrophica bacterium]|nr:response regulator [Candidatus Omnitrophota bacterium]MDD5487423.1 response regulator [Candidatus Omnitrophota bacterium]